MTTTDVAANGRAVLSSTLPTLHLDLLRAGDSLESKKLLDACRTYGFFYLDLSSDSTLCGYWEKMLAVAKSYFDQPLEVKMKDARGSDNTG
jgi:isopenicillin N synthase-like dioxygenase